MKLRYDLKKNKVIYLLKAMKIWSFKVFFFLIKQFRTAFGALLTHNVSTVNNACKIMNRIHMECRSVRLDHLRIHFH